MDCNPKSNRPTTRGMLAVVFALSVCLLTTKLGFWLRSDTISQIGFLSAITVTGTGLGYSFMGRAGLVYGLVVAGLTYVIACLIISVS